MTHRTTREAYGQQLTTSAFEDPRISHRKVAAIVAGIALVVLAAYQRDHAAEIDTLIENHCRYERETVDGQHIWHCHDGIRVSSIGGDTL